MTAIDEAAELSQQNGVVGDEKLDQQKQQNEPNKTAKQVDLVTSQVDEEQLRRLVQEEAMRLPDMNLALSGLAGRFPKSDSINEFEENLRQGLDMINDQDNSRFTCALWGLPPRAGRLKDLSRFDSDFFGFNLDEANYIDFQLRILYEVVYESILDAGVNPATLRATNTGVFFGLHCNEFENEMADDPAFKSNGYYAQFAVKVAQYFDFRGLTVTFDAACASGFVGLHNAVQALDEGLIDQAIVCSSNIPIHPTGSFIFLQMQMLSPTGYSRFLDSRADGYVKSEACVSCLLQKKHLARRNYASIMATMTSVDGYKKEGITFPSYSSQETLIRSTKQLARISTNHVEYLEAHGTGTPAGDPQEARAISSVYFSKEENQKDKRIIGPLLVGSVKTNMGHSEAASGLCALVKVALMLENELIYKSLHYAQPNTNIEALMDGRLKFVAENQPLSAKIIPLSCYGFGGSNVHSIVRANERPQICSPDEPLTTGGLPRLVVMFGRSQRSLESIFDKIMDRNSMNTQKCLTDDFLALLDSLNGADMDRLMNHRGYLLVDGVNKTELARSIVRCDLEPTRSLQEADLGRRHHLQDCQSRQVNLVLSGVGSEWPAMAAGLRQLPALWATIDRLVKILEPFEHQIDLVKSLTSPETQELFKNSISNTFVAIVAYQIALINLVKDQLKVDRLAYIVGHSLGEISCAYAAGLFDERETILVAYQMGRALDENKKLIEGRMIALNMSEAEANKLLASRSFETVQVCCVNGPESVTISGRRHEMDSLCSQLESSNIHVHVISNLFALHNSKILTSQMRSKLSEALERVLMPLTDYDRTKTSWISSFCSSSDDNDKLHAQANVDYFVEMLSRKVDFLGALQRLDIGSIVLEVGPSNLFESQIRLMNADHSKNRLHYVRTMRRHTEPNEQAIRLMSSFGELYQAGATFDLSHFYHGPDADKKLFPVRRQTPSLSSIFEWSHEHKFFVPRYPIQFSKSSAKSEMPVDIVQDRDKYLTGHCIEGRILYPATGYLFLIWRVFSFTKRKIFDACFQDVEKELVPIEFHNVRLLRAIILGNRVAQVYTHYEEATGRFEIKEGGSVVVEGYACSPGEKPAGLLYDHVRDEIEKEKLELTMTADDVYKQFRVSGYDYGETFRNIEQCSSDGRYCRVRYNGHFVALTDSILQSIFLAISQYAPSGGLFLPTRFDYVRFQPEIILKKLREAKCVFDLTDGSLNTKAKREIMTKMMERAADSAEEKPQTTGGEEGAKEANNDDEPNPIGECYFETYCDPTTGIIITDGIEMRGIKASPAPRRSDNNEVLLESYQFVRDYEEPVVDERLTKFEQVQRQYSRACDSMSMELLTRLCGQSLRPLNGLLADGKVAAMSKSQIDSYKRRHLACIYSQVQAENMASITEEDSETSSEPKDTYDIKKNGNRTLMSLFDQLLSLQQVSPKAIRERVQENRSHLMSDLIQSSWTSERFVRPLIETVIENVCMKKMKLRMMEVNLDDGLLRGSLQQLIQQIEPTLSLDYSLAHPEPSRLNSANKNTFGCASGNHTIRSHTLKDLSSLFADSQTKNLDFIIYKDISCYSLPKRVVEKNGLAPVMSVLNGAVRCGGYVMMIMRSRLTFAERVLLSLSEPELVGLTNRDLEMIQQTQQPDALSAALSKIDKINSILAFRCKLMLDEAEKNKMLYLARKQDENGCLILLFRRTLTNLGENSSTVDGPRIYNKNELIELQTRDRGKIVLRVRHDNLDWLDDLKRNFKKNEKKQEDEEALQMAAAADEEEPRQVWLCAVATKQNPINGLVGMMQALRKELGSSYLRCFYDAHTFKNRDEPIHSVDIGESQTFREALRRDQLWNCVDSFGKFGSFRHLTINDYLSHEPCLCSSPGESTPDDEQSEACNDNSAGPTSQLVPGAFVNQATRGDLSSFAWFEAPLRYLSAKDKSQLVRVAYSALNFRDIMLATGRLPLDAVPVRLAMSDCLLGLEFSGYDLDNKRVMGMVSGRGIASHLVCPTDSSIRVEVPDWMDLREAATIPVVYATAIMGLVYRGRMQRGESILIHAGSGGVGQAAIRLAAHWGLQVFTTVGSAEKRKFLLEEFPEALDETRIFNSRDCSFEQDVMRATRGQGVDLVLNSLADDKLQASLRCLKDGGRFLEIGKYDMSVDARLELMQLDTNKTFHGILLDKLFDSEEEIGLGISFGKQMACVLETLRRGLLEGFIKPIKYELFKRNQIEEAFRFMATGKHIGKVLIEIEPASKTRVLDPREGVALRCVPRCQLSPEKSFIVTGGLGGFGLELCKWLVNQGARHLVITSRSGPRTGYQRATLGRLESSGGCKILIVREDQADASQPEGAEKLCRMAAEMSPSKQLGGVFHLAMVLKDCLLENMSEQDFEQVCRPKVLAGVNLDAATRRGPHQLDYFVAFSSVTSGKGNAGQANYAYANSCLERICEQRRLDGQHGLAIQWGAIGDVGVAFENLGGNDVVIGGTIPQRMPSCLATLAKLLCSPFSTCLSVLPVNRSADGSGERGNLVDAIMHVLGIKDQSKVSDDSTLGDLGLDSLMAVEIRQYIEREYDMTLNIQEIRSLTIAKIREISDSDQRPSKKAAGQDDRTTTADGGQQTRQVDSYSSTALNGHSASNGGSHQMDQAEALKQQMQSRAVEALLDKSMVSTFVPQLELPRADFCRLNYRVLSSRKVALSAGGSPNSREPIFFIPPIHGTFDQLEVICAHVERPCIGLNWTRKLGRVRSVAEAVEVYLEVLRTTNWEEEFYLKNERGKKNSNNQVRRVDLVGYSYGATIAFEMMLALHGAHKDSKGLRAGKLILLDGSPKQIELGSKYLSNLTHRKPMKLAEKIDELLMVYIISHTRQFKVDYIKIQRQLQASEIDKKIELASEKLHELLRLNDCIDCTNAQCQVVTGGQQANGKANKKDNNANVNGNKNGNETGNGVENGNKLEGKPTVGIANDDKQTQIAYAMEAFCRRYELVVNYKASAKLPGDCTLIRAEKLYLSNNEKKYNEDLDLSSVVDGKVELFVMRGDHETFLNINHRRIGDIMTEMLS